MKKSTSRPSWDEYFLNIAAEVATRSKDPSTKTGCVLVDPNRRPISFGYNGTIQGADEEFLPLDVRPLKYHIVVHAEMNAILFAGKDLRGATCYTLFAPCENCLKHLIQAGVTRIVYRHLRVRSSGRSDSMAGSETDAALKALLRACPWVEVVNAEGVGMLEDLN